MYKLIDYVDGSYQPVSTHDTIRSAVTALLERMAGDPGVTSMPYITTEGGLSDHESNRIADLMDELA